MIKKISGIVLLLLLAAIGLFYWQNQASTVNVVLFGGAARSMSLSRALAIAYLVGIGVGLLFVLNWAFRDAFLRRRWTRHLKIDTQPKSDRRSGEMLATSEDNYASDSYDEPAPIQPDVLPDDDSVWQDREEV
ncbi:LapA family protein [Synechococcus sp. PCC 7336]|uniref:LapA family protein n=1 Tax=Synechococcus sp. PCC 7336 TaxID=195250 RepID=UPI00034BBF3F|nr:LapA family protein [Synechococcus sp. PCC 7336]